MTSHPTDCIPVKIVEVGFQNGDTQVAIVCILTNKVYFKLYFPHVNTTFNLVSFEFQALHVAVISDACKCCKVNVFPPQLAIVDARSCEVGV